MLPTGADVQVDISHGSRGRNVLGKNLFVNNSMTEAEGFQVAAQKRTNATALRRVNPVSAMTAQLEASVKISYLVRDVFRFGMRFSFHNIHYAERCVRGVFMIERTFSIIKPDATRRNLTGEINAMIEAAGFRIVAQKRIKATLEQAKKFYAVHSGKPFYDDLCAFLSSAPIIVQVLEKENAIADYRTLMGATNPANAEEGTIRKKFALSIDQNSVHGSDAPETAAAEIRFFFSETEIVG